MKKKCYLYYVESCTPKIKEFNNKNDLYKFTAEFGCTIYDNPDNWIEFAFAGDVFLKGDKYTLETK